MLLTQDMPNGLHSKNLSQRSTGLELIRAWNKAPQVVLHRPSQPSSKDVTRTDKTMENPFILRTQTWSSPRLIYITWETSSTEHGNTSGKSGTLPKPAALVSLPEHVRSSTVCEAHDF